MTMNAEEILKMYLEIVEAEGNEIAAGRMLVEIAVQLAELNRTLQGFSNFGKA